MRGLSLKVVALCGALGLLVLAGLARAEVMEKEALRVSVSGRLSPKALPRHATAPVSVSVGGRITTTDESQPPQLKTVRIEVNRHGHLDPTGLPVCPRDRIQPASSGRALAACGGALLGQGRFSANIVLSGQEPYPTQGRLLVFNGRSKGRPALLGQIYAPRPFASSFLIVFSVSHPARGAYGTVLTASLPKALGSWGYVTGIEMRLGRRFRYRGKRRSYVSAGCPAPRGFDRVPFPLARTTFSFSGVGKLSSTLNRTCTVRGIDSFQ